jgi:uncharacterized protein (DUF362 family)
MMSEPMPPFHTADSDSGDSPSGPACESTHGITRRQLLGLGGAALVGGGVVAGVRQWVQNESGLRAAVFIGRAESYDADLTRIILNGLRELRIGKQEIRGKRILLKPNLVETALGEAHINTHPSVVVAAAVAFQILGAQQVLVAEGQGHRRDSMLVLDESGMGDAVDVARLPFVDLNHDDVAPIANRGRWTKLTQLHLPKTLLAVDWIVSLPKLKTHHWAGVTCSMKNLFGVMPGIVYGWPKNVLHYHGISQSILDINATVRPHMAIVDGIVGMEGDGPILGPAKHVGCLIMGRNFPAVDATATRVMGLSAEGVSYLREASGVLGPIREEHIDQRGETIARVATRFSLPDWPHLRAVRGS